MWCLIPERYCKVCISGLLPRWFIRQQTLQSKVYLLLYKIGEYTCNQHCWSRNSARDPKFIRLEDLVIKLQQDLACWFAPLLGLEPSGLEFFSCWQHGMGSHSIITRSWQTRSQAGEWILLSWMVSDCHWPWIYPHGLQVLQTYFREFGLL